MPVRRLPSLALLLLSSAALLAGCGPQTQEWPGTGPQATEVPMTAAPIEPVQSVSTQVIVDPALNDRIARLERNVGGLESDVAGLQTDMTEAQPRLAKIDSMEKHFRQLSLELDRINKTYGVAPVAASPVQAASPAPAKKIVKVQPKPKAKPIEAKPQPPMALTKKEMAKPSSAAKKAATPLKVQQVRIGEQAGGKTRIVLDTTSPAKINYDIDNGEKILLLEVPEAGWAAKQAQTLKNSPLIASYKAESDAAGSRLIVQLKDEAKVVSTSRLDPSEGAGYRVFLDLAKK